MSSTTLWLIMAAILAGLEMLTGTFYLLAVATGLISAALAAWLGFGFAAQASSAALIGLLAVATLRQWHSTRKASPEQISSDIGQLVEIVEWQGERRARVRYRGTLWDAELAADADTGLNNYTIIATQGSSLILNHLPLRHS
ncbi:NfeD family protein [Iodobacter sp. HSC-16F04]|uniref:NfeD family protein n=1 Tax=Iodobacter violaceini TaxID=3044271 RepID=A0ABX0KW11_9NEIS|nr:NfeD family protein [Iodobacter violacea]NHQ86219.1 NfeD family protein [Iodobacter violacea]